MKELVIEYIPAKDGQGARVCVGYRVNEHAQQQRREDDFSFEFSDDERELMRWYLENYLQCPWGAFRDRAARAEATMQRKGAELFEAVFKGGSETRELYDNVRADLSNTRFVIHAADGEGVSLPWELMRDPKRANCDLARLTHSFVRSQSDLDYDPPLLDRDGTFNILLVICRPDGEDDVPFQSVARRLLSAVRNHRGHIHIDVLRPPTFEELSRVLRDKPSFYHTLHFDGHGAFPGGAMPGVLLFEGETGPRRLVNGQELGRLLTQYRLPLVVLNACQSGLAAPEAAYISVGNQLLQAGVSSVVAMAYSIYVKPAAHFIARFYEMLVQGQEVARAVHAGREELATNNLRFSPIGDLPISDWIVPVLFEAAPLQITALHAGRLRLALRDTEDEDPSILMTGLPEPPPFGFIGRDDATQKLERAFIRENVVLLRGLAGVGKTSVAVGFARWLAETGGFGGVGELQGRAFFTSFGHYATLETAINPIGCAFNAYIKRELQQDWEQISDPTSRRTIALQILRQVPCLLLWDNFEPVHGFPEGTESDWTDNEQRELRDFLRDLRDSRTKVLLTSRRTEGWLNHPTEIYRDVELSGLRLSEAQELAVLVLERAGANHYALEQIDDYNALLQFLRGNPLAIQAVLPELTHRKPMELLDDLRSGEAKLSKNDAQDRDRSLRASLDYCFAKLDLFVRQRLWVLSLFQGFVNIRVLATMGGLDGAPDFMRDCTEKVWQESLDTVAQLGLLNALGNGVYAMHPALPWFFRTLDLGEEADLQWMENSFVFCYRELSIQSRHLENGAFPYWAQEEGNLVHALSLSHQLKHWDALTNIFCGWCQILEYQLRWNEWELVIKKVEQWLFDSAGRYVPEAEEAVAIILATKADLSRKKGNLADAQKYADEAFQHLSLKSNSEVEMAEEIALSIQAQSSEALGDFSTAERLYGAALGISAKRGDRDSQARHLLSLGIALIQQNKLSEGARILEDSLRLFKETNNVDGQLAVLFNQATILQRREQWQEAEDILLESLNSRELMQDKFGYAKILHQLGNLSLRLGRFEKAEEFYRRSLTIKQPAGDEEGAAVTLYQLGICCEMQNKIPDAVQFFQLSEQAMRAIGNTHYAAIAISALQRLSNQQD